MAGRNRAIGSLKFLRGGSVGRGKASVLTQLQGPAGEPGDDGAEGADGADGADGNIVDVVTVADFNPANYNEGDVVMFVDDYAEPTTVSFGGKKGQAEEGEFPDPVPLT